MSSQGDKLNPLKKPLEELIFETYEDGILRKIPALSANFSSDRPMISFLPPPKKTNNGSFLMGAKEEWFHKMEIFKANLRWLLGLPHHRFWSQIVYGKKTWDSVISCLQEAYPFYAMHNLPDDRDIIEMYNEICYLVFCVLCRVTTQQESPEAWIGKQKYGELLYNNTLISLPILFDVCVIYGYNNKEEVSQMVTDVFTIQPLYKEDLDTCVQHIKNVFNSIEERFLKSGVKPELYNDKKIQNGKMNIGEIYDIILYLLDISATLYSFVDCYSEGALTLHLNRLEVTLAQFYDKIMPDITRQIQEIVGRGNISYDSLMFCLNQARFFFLKLFYVTVQSCLNVIIENRSTFPEELLKYNAESCLNVIGDSLPFKIFISDYEKKFPIEQDLDVLSQVYPLIDEQKMNSILSEIHTNSKISTDKSFPKTITNDLTKNERGGMNFVNGDSSSSSNFDIKLSQTQIDSLISEVKDILPHLGDGFILKCLEHYNYKKTEVINAVLENLLPDKLSTLDPDLPIIPPEPGTNVCEGGLSHRVNVFDNDEFDIMTRDSVDTSRIHKGKRKEEDAKQILNDKSFREELRTKFSELGIVETDEIYDDEYDDTYDDVVAPIEEENQDEREFVVPRVLQQQRRPRAELCEEDENEEAEENGRDHGRGGFVPFVENPEVIRARREQRRISKGKGPPPPRDVVGKAKGQGQETEVLNNRYKKNVFKSAQGNHNRKKGAQFKRSQGFIPS